MQSFLLDDMNTPGMLGVLFEALDMIKTNKEWVKPKRFIPKMKEEFMDTPLEQMALDAVNAQSTFLITSLKDPSGGFYNGYTLNQGADNSAKAAVSQAAAARGLYAAYELTGNSSYLDAADEAYAFLMGNYYVSGQMAFRTEQGNDLATYTPFNFAIITGALREANLVGGHTEAAAVYTRFFKKVANVMQLAEFDPSGETGGDSDGDGIPFLPEQPDQLAPVFATEAQLNLQYSGIDDFISNPETDVVIYPNPAKVNATLTFKLERAAEVRIETIDFTGKTIQTILNDQVQEGQFRTSWNVSALPAGIYYVRIIIGNSEVLTKKVVVL
jgi:hypothetical protein